MPEKIQPSEKKKLHKEILKQMVTLATSGFGLVAALAWNNVIQELVNDYIKPYLASGSGLLSLLLYAILITTLAVTVTYQLTKLVEKLENT
ncbi:MAG: DUF5654 family protein [Patescibacteria group bacterium]